MTEKHIHDFFNYFEVLVCVSTSGVIAPLLLEEEKESKRRFDEILVLENFFSRNVFSLEAYLERQLSQEPHIFENAKRA
jgi:hypothetical protein